MARTLVEVLYPYGGADERRPSAARRVERRGPSSRAGGGALGLRGNQLPLSWARSLPPTRSERGRHLFELDLPAGELLEFKVTRGELFSRERNHTVISGETAVVRPYFDRSDGSLDPAPQRLRSPQLGRVVDYRVFLPPSYAEHTDRRYPVLYAQDGHALFAENDPTNPNSFRIDETLNELYELGAIEEVIVVGIHTEEGRLEMLSPTRDSHHGGGDGPGYLDFLIATLKPVIDAGYRTLADRGDTAVLGSSMGGLFSFFAAWTRPDVFGKAACLSSAFWWDDRRMVRVVLGGQCPAPRPMMYIDSGAARHRFDEDPSHRDGFHHTVAMRDALLSHCYVAGVNVHMLAFAGASHEGAAWAARLAFPLQLLFPRSPLMSPVVAREPPIGALASKASA